MIYKFRLNAHPNSGKPVNRKSRTRIVKPVDPLHHHHRHEGEGGAKEPDEASFDGRHEKATSCIESVFILSVFI